MSVPAHPAPPLTAAGLPRPATQRPPDPLHGVRLDALLAELVAHFGWDGLAQHVPVRCFMHQPSTASSLAFLRKTPWARARVEQLFVNLRHDQTR